MPTRAHGTDRGGRARQLFNVCELYLPIDSTTTLRHVTRFSLHYITYILYIRSNFLSNPTAYMKTRKEVYEIADKNSLKQIESTSTDWVRVRKVGAF